MLRIDRIAMVIFTLSFLLLIPTVTVAGYVDEIAAILLLILALADSITNRCPEKYKLLWITTAISACYILYSIVCKNYNHFGAILSDGFIQIKSIIALSVFMGIRPRIDEHLKKILKSIAIINCVVCTIVLLLPTVSINLILSHISYGGINIFVSVCVFLLCSVDSSGRISVSTKLIAALLLTGGLLCSRAKFYGEFVVFITLMMSGELTGKRWFRPKYVLLTLVSTLLALIAGWNKVSFYFLENAIGTSGTEAMETIARPVLYATGAMILVDHFPFGSGLASFASYKSASPYSGLYSEYGIDKVYGLSEAYPSFICDAYYPSLAQFGIVGVILFVMLTVYIIRKLMKLLRGTPAMPGYFITGILCLSFLLIESIGNTTIIQAAGVTAMSVTGICCGEANRNIYHHDRQ